MREEQPRRLRVEILGAVQGVGFRPFVYRIARELGLRGRVVNDRRGLIVEAEGPRARLDELLRRLTDERPTPAVVESIDSRWLEPAGYDDFRIEASDERGAPTVQVLPDVALCADCRAEVLDPGDRRKGYPFTNCTNCGPRFSIVRALPYDRARTTMSRFEMCAECSAEYEDPADRRFHAQPNACPSCGPQLELWDGGGKVLARREAALTEAAKALADGRVVAVKGLGGFHLMVDARNGDAVARLREKKPRREKPLALMVRDLEQARALCRVDDDDARVLSGAEAPIVLLPRRAGAPVDDGVAPGNPHLGLMLPYTPLHELLLREVGFPVVATSGNLSDEPICTDEREALERLGRVAERFLVHDRPIARHVDDSIVWVIDGEPRLLRRARGFAPRPVLLDRESLPVLAVGAHLKNAVALGVGHRVFVSQHIGDMETPEAIAAFERVIEDFLELYEARPAVLACDLHPDYFTTRWARAAAAGENAGGRLAGLPVVAVQHHHAHLAACLAEHGRHEPALGVTWDGTGYGTDGTVWGGEFLAGNPAGFDRVARLRRFRLPGGEAAVREPRRTALGLLWPLLGTQALEREDLAAVRAFGVQDRRVLGRMLERGVNAPWTTSAGRLFDGVAALLDLRQRTTFEGQAAMTLEHVAGETTGPPYPIEITESDGEIVLDWLPLVEAVLDDLRRGVAAEPIAARFHDTLVDGIVRVAREVGLDTVALSGGCFQNRRLTMHTAQRLRAEGFTVLLHRSLPPNDGGISTGQIAVAAAAR